jgi:nucleoside 2-deoxyribosyltransferase
MTAYISGALLNASNLDESRRLYESFAAACERAGCAAYVPHQHADPVHDVHLSNAEVVARDLEAIAAADVLVAFVGEPSLGVGAEIAIALAAGKRVLALAPAEYRVSRFALGLLERAGDQAMVLRYQTEADAVAWLTRTVTDVRA